MADYIYFIFHPAPNGNVCIGRILSVVNNTVSVQWWLLDDERADSTFLPPPFMESKEHDVIPTPLLSSLVFMF